MSVCFISDVHLTNPKKFGGTKVLGINARCSLILRTLERAYVYAQGSGATDMYILGDFFDIANPGPRVIAAGQAVIAKARDTFGIRTHIIPGNHDLFSSALGDHALGPLRPVSRIIDVPTRDNIQGLEVVSIPFRPGDAKEWLGEIRRGDIKTGLVGDEEPAWASVLALHLGIQTEKSENYLKNDLASIPQAYVEELLDRYDCDQCLSGHWHRYEEVSQDPFIAQCGALSPTGWSDGGLDGYGSIWTISRAKPVVTRTEISGARFVKVRGEQAFHAGRSVWKNTAPGTKVFLELELEREAKAAALIEIEKLRANESICQARIVYDTRQATRQIREAAAAVCRASSMSEALEAYVRGLKITAPARTANVLEHAKRLSGI